MRRLLAWLLALVTLAGCATVPENAYYPNAGDPGTRILADALYRAARAASQEAGRYSFAMVRTAEVRAYTGGDATFYFSDGLARQPRGVVDALVAHELAHELLDHLAPRRAQTPSTGADFTVLGIAIPGGNFLDRMVNTRVMRVYTRDQEISADRKAVEVLRDMGHQTPRRVLADALRAAAAINSAADRASSATDAELRERLAALEPLEPVALTR